VKRETVFRLSGKVPSWQVVILYESQSRLQSTLAAFADFTAYQAPIIYCNYTTLALIINMDMRRIVLFRSKIHPHNDSEKHGDSWHTRFVFFRNKDKNLMQEMDENPN
jgi:hypothetical protein